MISAHLLLGFYPTVLIIQYYSYIINVFITFVGDITFVVVTMSISVSPNPVGRGPRKSFVATLNIGLMMKTNITITCPCNIYPLTFHYFIVKLGLTFTVVYIFFLFFALKQIVGTR